MSYETEEKLFAVELMAQAPGEDTIGGYVAVGRGNSKNSFLQKLSSDGQTEWHKTLDLDQYISEISSVTQTDDGRYITCGLYGHVIKLDTSGELEWNYKSHDPSYRRLKSVDVTLSGDYLVAGGNGGEVFLLKVGQNGELQSTKSHATAPGGYRDYFVEMDQLAGGDVALLIERSEPGIGGSSDRPLIVELDSEGNLVSGN